MKKKLRSIILISVLVLSASLLICGCTKDKDTEEIINPIEISMSVSYPKEANLDNIEKTDFKVEEDSTVSDALQLYCNISDISVTIDTTSGVVNSINSVSNGDINEKYTWKYKINGKFLDTPANEQIVNAGDTIEWVYKK